MVVMRTALTQNRSVQDIESRKQCGRSVPFVVMRHRFTASLFHGKSRLTAIQRLDLTLFIDRKHQGMLRRVKIQADDIFQLFREAWIAADLKRFEAMRLQSVSLPNTSHAGLADSRCAGHAARTPMGSVSGALLGRLADDPLNINLPRAPRTRGVFFQSCHSP